ncbi:unnamed protein product [Arctia plantaginis]|uniref:CRAL-TRIO domain-containing protein n=1 Tax=Arctia plantaginis TaxID=874455 RepID=A0A8S0YTL2_ARCPL|nr:unnamed protein product [Arctia plantaginis]
MLRASEEDMEELKPNPILKFNEGQLQSVRQIVGYEDVNKLKQDLELLIDWIKKQNHFGVKEFDPEYLERVLIYNKGSIENAKLRIEKTCTYVNLMPEFLKNYEFGNDFQPLLNIVNICVLPKPTRDNYRILISQFTGIEDNKFDILDYYRYHVVIGLHTLYYDYCVGFELIIDLRMLTLGIVTKFNPVTMKKGLTLIVETTGERVKKVHLLCGSKFLETVILLAKQGLSAKLRERLVLHNNIESLYDHIPREELPKNYGGYEKSTKELSDMNYEEWSSDIHKSRLKLLENSATDESLRLPCKFNEEYSGMPGSFKKLCVD